MAQLMSQMIRIHRTAGPTSTRRWAWYIHLLVTGYYLGRGSSTAPCGSTSIKEGIPAIYNEYLYCIYNINLGHQSIGF